MSLARVAVIIPAWNEADAVAPVVGEVLREGVGTMILATGDSTDSTPTSARAVGARVIDAGRGHGRA